jgi:hypothetical protein
MSYIIIVMAEDTTPTQNADNTVTPPTTVTPIQVLPPSMVLRPNNITQIRADNPIKTVK